MVNERKSDQVTGNHLNFEEIIKRTDTMPEKKVGRRKNLVPSHIYKAIREYHAKGYSYQKIGGIVKKEFPNDIKISGRPWLQLIYRTIYNNKVLVTKEKDVQSDTLGILDGVLDGTEEVSNVRPSVYKPQDSLPVGAINTYNSLQPKTEWEVNTAVVTTANGDKITINFSNKTLKEFIKDTLR